jgi:uncharacterized protein (UPF0218 family)
LKIRFLTPALRKKLKSPLGLLIQGSVDETIEQLKSFIEEEKPTRIISVGDAVSNNMIEKGISPDVLIVDNRVMRKKVRPIPVDVSRTLNIKNAPGTVTDEAWTVIEDALKQKQTTRVLVDGEEDLLTLVAVLCAPEKSLVVYGQPQVGIVAVKVTEQKKKLARRLVEEME